MATAASSPVAFAANPVRVMDVPSAGKAPAKFSTMAAGPAALTTVTTKVSSSSDPSRAFAMTVTLPSEIAVNKPFSSMLPFSRSFT